MKSEPHFPALVGILNVTPDSFSDGGVCSDNVEKAVAFARLLCEDGAGVIDVGGESTRPGFTPVSEAEELRRVLPVVRRLTAELSVPISIDTTKAVVAAEALDAGVWLVNDISGGTFDERMISVVAEKQGAVCLGHIFGDAQTMHQFRETDDIVREVTEFLAARRDLFLAAGVPRNRIYLDPGIGFGKTPEQNNTLLAHIPELLALGCRLMVGVSRKRFLGGGTLEERDRKTAEWTTRLIEAGVDLVRVHRREARLPFGATAPLG